MKTLRNHWHLLRFHILVGIFVLGTGIISTTILYARPSEQSPEVAYKQEAAFKGDESVQVKRLKYRVQVRVAGDAVCVEGTAEGEIALADRSLSVDEVLPIVREAARDTIDFTVDEWAARAGKVVEPGHCRRR